MIFDLFKTTSGDHQPDVKGTRHALLQFIKQELQKAEGGEGGNIRGLLLYLSCGDRERHIYESAVYDDEPGRLKAEVQRIADDYALGLPDTWTLEVLFEKNVPSEATKAADLDAAFFIKTNKHFIRRSVTAYLRALSGETVHKEYTITSEGGKINIGRDQKAQVDDGFFRTNHIAFPSESASESNRFISRQHAHIEWSAESGRFLLFADDGGIPPRNKVKVRSEESEHLVKLHSSDIGHELKEGDQVVLGESAVLEFSYRPLHDE
ncbi:FHA domain-containing protein [Hufsiella ginkgonis]|uniref:FHA domain-containing protein n=1 Tax=Hufsiella ginkgonis TaxID=2695274 RepID=A0A7K1Y0N5_9SPHI|nr:FHA domain-containing protein [Hufsiella ginkgonis]MXV16772.1 FHA domain-containing protein [Hufsiella ginkgonis]